MKKRWMLWLLAVAMFFCPTACDAGKGSVVSAPSAKPGRVDNQQVKSMKIRIKVGEKEATGTLSDSQTARDFVSLLPPSLTLEDYAKTEKISDLPRRLSTDGAPAGSDPSVGDIAYYAPWGNLAIFYRDFGDSNGLVILGKMDGDVEAFSARGSLKATIELAK